MAYAKGQSFPVKKTDSTFVAKCTCTDPKCNIEQVASRTNRFFGGSNNVAIACMSQLKEVSTAAPIPGLRQAAGGALIILETIGLMGDNAAAFDQIAAQSIDNCMLLVHCKEIIDLAQSKGAGAEVDKAKDLLDGTAAEFSKAMEHITQSMIKLNARGKIKRFFSAKADRNELEKHRSAMAHLINKLQIVMQATTIARTGDSSKEIKPLTQDDIHDSVERYAKILVDRKENECKQQIERHNSPEFTTNATLNFQAGGNSTVYRSGNITTKVISGENDYSNNTSHITVTNGDFLGYGDSRRSRHRRRNSDSSDSDEQYRPHRRLRPERELRERVRSEQGRYQERW